jgi:CheY-like chemotaxis protein/two-component sensor histidine kinase
MIERSLLDIQSGAQRVARIVTELRSFARPRASQVAAADLARCVEWALRVTAHEFSHRASLVTEVDPVPPVGMDETQLGQVLVNLLVNAAHAIPPGDVDHNRVTLRAQAESAALVRIEVHDTGEGMSRAVLDHIFDPFFTTKRVGVGTGLGLAICHGIVTSAGGRIEAQSVPGNGSTFRVFLPVAKAKPEAHRDREPAAAQRHARILVIDDEEMVLRLFRLALNEHEVREATRAKDALELLEAGETFDLIICDLMMPNMTGVEFYERLLASRPELAKRVVFLTGGAVSSHTRDFIQSVSNTCLSKPFDLDGLRRSIRTLLEETPATRAVR